MDSNITTIMQQKKAFS